MGRGSATNKVLPARARSAPPKLADAGKSKWDTGYCGEYALALCDLFPHLRLGQLGSKLEDGGWFPEHCFAHDDDTLYDVTGARPLRPYLDDPDTVIDLDYPREAAWDEVAGFGDFLQGVGDEVAEAREAIRAALG